MYSVNKTEKYAADLEEALEIVGLGWFNLTHSAILILCLIGFAIEQYGYSVVLLAAACDLQMSNSTRGIVTSLPYVGYFLASYPCGYLTDTQGRKKTLIYSCLIAGIFSIMSGLMPNVISFTTCKVLSSLCLPCLAGVSFTYVEEIMPTKYRDIMISLMNGLQMIGSLLVPLLAWAILSMNFRIDFGFIIFRPWRLLDMIYASVFIITAIMLCFCPESPKYLVSQDKYDEALNVLQIIYAHNKGKKPEEFPINRLTDMPTTKNKSGFLVSLREQSAPILKWVYLKRTLLTGFLLFGSFSITNGIYLWVPDVINKVVSGEEKGKTACQIITYKNNQTSTENVPCNDNISMTTLYLNSVGQAVCVLVIILISTTVNFIGKKSIPIIVLAVTGTICILVNFITNETMMAILLVLLPIAILTMGSVNAYIVEIMPTHLRGVALTMSLMLGVIGCIVTNSAAGYLINDECEAIFYFVGGLVLFCSALSFLLPNTRSSRT